MEYSLVFNFNNFNDSIAKNAKYVGNNLYVDIIIDGEHFYRIEGSKSFKHMPEGTHTLYCVLCYEIICY